MKKYTQSVKITFIEPVLGTAPNDPGVYSDFIASKSSDAPSRQEEIDAIGVDESIDKGTTVFPRKQIGDRIVPFLWDYQLKGLFKEKCGFLRAVSGKGDDDAAAGKGAPNLSSAFSAYKKKIDGLIFVEDRVNPIELPEGKQIEFCERPLRAETAQGPRVSLARSEEIPAGSTCTFKVFVMNKKHLALVHEWLEFGIFHGTGQWRNSGKGRFIVEYGEVEEGEIEYAEYAQRALRVLKERDGIDIFWAGLGGEIPGVEAAPAEAAPKKRGRKKAEPAAEEAPAAK